MTTNAAALAEDIFRRAVLLHRESRLDDARALYDRTLEIDPKHFQALHLLGVIALQNSQAKRAAELFTKALSVDPSSVSAHVNLGTAQHELRRFEDALASYQRAIDVKPDCAEAFFNRGNSLRELNRHAAAVTAYDTTIALRPDYAEAYLNRGLSLAALQRPQDAVDSYEKGLAIRPNLAELWFNRGNELRTLGLHEAALASYDRALALQPGFADAHLNRGTALIALRRYAAALASYDRAIGLRPDHAESYFNRAGALQYSAEYAAAAASYDAAISIRPRHAASHANRARALRELKNYEGAISGYDRALSLDPSSTEWLAIRRQTKMQICDWRQLDADIAKISARVADGEAVHPFYMLTLVDSAETQKLVSEAWVRGEHPANTTLGWPAKRARGERIHIGYFSADFHEHATSYLIAELLERHDRARFRISAFSFGPHSTGAMRQRLTAACDEFIDVRDKSDVEITQLARRMGIDIAVDLKGFTQDHRAGIFAARAAPLQVNYLGYPGTLGAPYIDYLIADRTVIPGESQRHYTEKILYLPHSYQANDGQRPIAHESPSRAQLGLPANAFVFCCFNNSYKITPGMFHRWMRILGRVEHAVLWLLADNATAVRNLRNEAAVRYVDPERLIFAERTNLPLHLARHRAADLFLDTLPCNAHTTASDALWAGLPVLTCPGEAFAARVAASLLTALEMPELIAASQDDYEQLAIDLAIDHARLAAIREKLAIHKQRTPLFDSTRFTRDLERGYEMMYARYQADDPPDHLYVAPSRVSA